MKNQTEEKTLTRAEMEVMNVLWDHDNGITTHEIVSYYPDPKPAYTTIATFLKILTTKGFISFQKRADCGKSYHYYPLITRTEYTSRFMKEVKTTLFGGSAKSMVSFFMQQEKISDQELHEILSIIKDS
ncbi:MAG: BlaI/MecI/CopY family transcriptional regulator [Prevotella sp.]